MRHTEPSFAFGSRVRWSQTFDRRMNPFTIYFNIVDEERFAMAVRAYDHIRQCKEAEKWPETDNEWKLYFDQQALSHFWWPTQEEKDDWARRWTATPVPQRFTEPSLKTPWDFMSMFDAFQNGEYTLLPIERVNPKSGILPFDPHSHPYGGTGCMQAFLESFELEVTHVDD